jgi:hypothetical protein
VSYQPFLVDEHVKHILLLSPAPKRLIKRTPLLLLEVVTYLPLTILASPEPPYPKT